MTASSRGEKLPIVDENGDFIFRFRLEPDCMEQPVLDDAFAELFRSQLDELLKLVVLTWKGKRLRVDGFSFISKLDCIFPIWQTGEDKLTSEQN